MAKKVLVSDEGKPEGGWPRCRRGHEMCPGNAIRNGTSGKKRCLACDKIRRGFQGRIRMGTAEEVYMDLRAVYSGVVAENASVNQKRWRDLLERSPEKFVALLQKYEGLVEKTKGDGESDAGVDAALRECERVVKALVEKLK